MLIDVTSALIRALSFVAMFQAAGLALFLALLAPPLQRSSRRVRNLGFGSAIAAIVLVALHYCLEAARMAGTFRGVFDPDLQQLVLDSRLSNAAAWRLLGLALIAGSIRLKHGVATQIATLGAMCVLLGFTFVGHTAADDQPVWLALVLVLHLMIAAFWFGSLAPLIIISVEEPAQRTVHLIAKFTRFASIVVPGLLLMGIVLTLALVPRWSVFGESYGLLLIAKTSGFASLMVLASLNKWRHCPSLEHSPTAAASFRRTVAAEYVVICAVFAVTAVMTTFFSPQE